MSTRQKLIILPYAIIVLSIIFLAGQNCGGGGQAINVDNLDGKTDVSVSSTFIKTFSIAVDTSTLTSSNFFIAASDANSVNLSHKAVYDSSICDSSDALSATIICNSLTSCTLDPTSDLSYSTSYTLCLTPSISYSYSTLSLNVKEGDDDEEEDSSNIEVCSGSAADCFLPTNGWEWYGLSIEDSAYLFDVTAIEPSTGLYRMYGQDSQNTNVVSYTSSDALTYTKEDGNRLVGNSYMPFPLTLSDGRVRLYFTDQSTDFDMIKSAISSDGLTFTVEDGVRLSSDGSAYEANGVGRQKILELSDGSYRMFYVGTGSDNIQRVLSATSTDGLTWTRENIVIFDSSELCPPATTIGNFNPIITPDNIYHLFIRTGTCGEEYEDEIWGIYDSTSSDGINFTLGDTPIIKDYYIESEYVPGDPTSPRMAPQDPDPLYLYGKLILYFGPYIGPDVADISGVYALTKDIFPGETYQFSTAAE